MEYKYVKFRPWVGEYYKNGKGFRGKKILILGDSHYCAKECSENGCCYPKCEFSPKCESAEEQNKKLSTCLSMTNYLILKEYIEYRLGNLPPYKDKEKKEKNNYNYLKTLLCFERNVCGHNTTKEDSLEFWNSVVFYNYKQHAQPSWNKARETSPAEYGGYCIAFEEVLKKYDPNYIIVWGKNAFSDKNTVTEIEYADGYKAPIKEFTVSNETNTKRIQALIVEHPSGSNGKSRAKWHTILKAFLKLDD